MRDKQIFTILRTTLKQIFSQHYGIDLEVVRNYQPTLQGRDHQPALYLYKLFDQRVGHVKRKERYRRDTDDFQHFEIQHYESTFQINALAREDPAEINGYTASDYANMAAEILQSDAGIVQLAQCGLRPLRITTLRNSYFENDSQQWEAMPSFDVVLTHHVITQSTVSAAQEIEGKLYHGNKYQTLR